MGSARKPLYTTGSPEALHEHLTYYRVALKKPCIALGSTISSRGERPVLLHSSKVADLIGHHLLQHLVTDQNRRGEMYAVVRSRLLPRRINTPFLPRLFFIFSASSAISNLNQNVWRCRSCLRPFFLPSFLPSQMQIF
jgi:hypothetical protein